MTRLMLVFSRTVPLALALAALAGTIAPHTGEAQAIWTSLPLEPGAWFEVTKVDFEEEQNLSTFSTTIYMGTRVFLRDDLQFVGELPVSNVKDENSFLQQQTVGNPYVGVEWGQSEAITWELGLRLPLGESPSANLATRLGVASDAPDRLEAWVDQSFAFQLAPNFIHRGRDGMVLRLRGGPSVLVPVGDRSGDSELILAYGGQVGYEGDLVHLLGGVSGRVVATGGGETFSHVVASVAFDLGGLRPAAIVRIPFGDLKGVDAVYGISLFFPIGP